MPLEHGSPQKRKRKSLAVLPYIVMQRAHIVSIKSNSFSTSVHNLDEFLMLRETCDWARCVIIALCRGAPLSHVELRFSCARMCV